MEAISTNPNILEKIFLMSKTKALLQCRLVCKLWAQEAARILRKRGIAIAFRCIEDIEEYLQVPRPTPITFLNFIVDIPSRYPLADDSYGGIQFQIADLLECYSGEVKNLKIWYQPLVSSAIETENVAADDSAEDEISPNEVVTFHNLCSLQLLSNYVQQMTPGQQGENGRHQMPSYFTRISAPKLISLAVQHLYDTECTSIVSSIIRSSERNLEYFKIPAKAFPAVALDSSISLTNLRELDLLGIFHGFSCSTTETLDSIIKACPQLEKLGIEFSFRVPQIKIQELLKVLCATLKELRCTIQDRNLLARQIVRVDFIFPEMAKLTSLQMRWSNPGFIYYIDKLPQLRELLLDTVWTRKIPGNVYPNGQPFQQDVADYKQLTSLKLSEIVNMEHIQAFSQYFPSLKILGCSFDSNDSLRMVYTKMMKLTCLIIERKSNITEAGGVCGMEEDAMRKLNENLSDGTNESVDLIISRRLPYIGDLKDLEALELCQLGVTWCSLQFAITDLPKLKTLVIQSRTLKKPHCNGQESGYERNPFITLIGSRMPQLRTLTLWIRHKSERPSTEDMRFIGNAMCNLSEFNVVNHSLCGI